MTPSVVDRMLKIPRAFFPPALSFKFPRFFPPPGPNYIEDPGVFFLFAVALLTPRSTLLRHSFFWLFSLLPSSFFSFFPPMIVFFSDILS